MLYKKQPNSCLKKARKMRRFWHIFMILLKDAFKIHVLKFNAM